MRFSSLLLLTVFYTVNFSAFADDWRMVEEKQRSAKKSYQPLDIPTFIQLEQAFEHAFRADQLDPLTAFYQLTLEHDGVQPLSVLKSNDDLGWGTITLNHSVEKALFLQVPHRLFDQHTGQIANHWLQTGRFKLAMINSVHRNTGRDSKPPFNSDFSTAPNNPFVAATRAFINSFSDPLVIQLHGFDRNKRKSVEGQHSDVILSHGANLPKPYLKKLNKAADCIKRDIGVETRVFPQSVRELGGTKNVVGKQLRKKGYFQRFIHLELSAGLRKKLRDNNVLSNRLLDCVVNV